METFEASSVRENEILSDGYDAILAQLGNPLDLAKKLIQMINGSNLGVRLSQNTKLKAQKYSWNKIGGLTMDLYASVHKTATKVSDTRLNACLHNTERK